MCGISGIISKKNIYFDLYQSLFHLQHRGQDSCGMVLYDNNQLLIIKRDGLIKNINENIEGDYNIGIGHIRYKTNGNMDNELIQPFILDNIILCHNGNIYNDTEIVNYILKKYNILVDFKNDSDLLLKLFYYEIKNKELNEENIEKVIINISSICKGSFNVIIHILDYGIICFKDKYGFRPLCYGKNKDGYIISSESIAINNLDYEFINEINPGEMIIIKDNLDFYKKQYIESDLHFCIFEYIYMSRPETILNGINVYDVRLKLGEYLARELTRNISKEEYNNIDYIIPIPQTSKPVALMMSEKLKIPYREGIINNRYIDRTFIMNNQKNRKKNIKLKMSVVKSMVKNKNIVIVDDSIVRGNTIRYIIDLLKENEVNKIYVCISSPPIKHKNLYGIDISTDEELIANQLKISEIQEQIGADKLVYLKSYDMVDSIKHFNNDLHFDLSIFNGYYII